MAAQEPWNRVNVPFPSAASSVRAQFSRTTDTTVKALLVENDKVLRIIGSDLLQTEIRVLYELLYVLNNSARGNKTYKGLQQVEQCVNRLKSMKLDEALHELVELCPNRIQRGLGVKAGQCAVPSQPKLEWLCLKVLGAAQLMSCTLDRCTRAFSLSKQQMKWEEFVILNVVITSMLSRLWVMFRGVLVCLSPLYDLLLKLLSEVALAQPMPSLGHFSLPADLALFLGPSSDTSLLGRQSAHGPRPAQLKSRPAVRVRHQGQARKVKEDMGVAIERGGVLDTNMKPFLKIFRTLTQDDPSPQDTSKKHHFRRQVREAKTFTDMAARLEEMIRWCRSKKQAKEKRLLTFLRLKCQRMKHLEAAGHNFKRKLRTFRQEVCRASSLGGSVTRKRPPSFDSARRDRRLRTRFHSLRSQFKSISLRPGARKTGLKTQRKSTELSADEQIDRTARTLTSQTTDCGSQDDIDDIFASIGL